jgi:hypothetical protein
LLAENQVEIKYSTSYSSKQKFKRPFKIISSALHPARVPTLDKKMYTSYTITRYNVLQEACFSRGIHLKEESEMHLSLQ